MIPTSSGYYTSVGRGLENERIGVSVEVEERLNRRWVVGRGEGGRGEGRGGGGGGEGGSGEGKRERVSNGWRDKGMFGVGGGWGGGGGGSWGGRVVGGRGDWRDG